MSEKEKEILVRMLMAGWRLFQSREVEKAERHARQVADAVSDLMDESDNKNVVKKP